MIVSETNDAYLLGVGFYEDTYTNGVLMSSMAGGCEVMFYGQGMAMDPSMISVVFQSDGFGRIDMGSPDPCKFGTIEIIFSIWISEVIL